MNSCYFVTGTDTEIGKTFVSCALLQRAHTLGFRTVGLKPIAAGTDAHGDNEDVVRLKAASSLALANEVVNPYCFAPPIAPHIAAAEAGVRIDFARIAETVRIARSTVDFVIVEGVGGFRVPLSDTADTADLAAYLDLPVILVVGMRLGCLSHALLSAEAILARGLRLAGWVANHVSPEMSRQDENFAALSSRLPAPCLGRLPFAVDAASASVAHHLALPAPKIAQP